MREVSSPEDCGFNVTLVGAVGYAAFAAYAHQVQHERPELVFWMPVPVHTVHHVYQQWRKNFGIGVDWWDRAVGTYEKTDWVPNPAREPRSASPGTRRSR